MLSNILTFDLEDWYHGNFLNEDISEWDTYEDRVVEPTLKIISMLENTGNKATFFVLGYVAEKFPELVEQIHQKGHEIASHGYDHKLAYEKSKSEFEADVKRSIEMLEEITNEKVIGYRAPYWSLNEDMDWAWEVLYSCGIQYDSSIYPFKTYLYGSNHVPRFRYQINLIGGNAIIELPPSTIELFGKRIPFCGGFYFRILPYWFIKWGIQRINEREKQPVVFYLHPYEIDVNKPQSSKGFRNNFILHVNLKKAEYKLFNLLKDHKFTSIKEFYHLPS